MSVIADLKELIARGKTKEAIGAVLEIVQRTGDSELYNEAVMLSARFSDLRREKNMGTIAFQDANIQSNRITDSLLNVLDQLPQATPGKLTYEKPSGERLELSSDQQQISGSNNIGFQNISGGTIHLTIYQNQPQEQSPSSHTKPESSNLKPNTMEITALAAAAVAALSPYLVKGAESFVGEAGKSLWELIQGKFSKDEKAKKKLDKLKENPEDKTTQERLKHELMDFLEEDSDFAAQLQKQLQDLPKEAKNNIMNITGNNAIGIMDVSGSQININKDK